MRAEAAARGLTVAHKPDSHDICFIPDGDTRGWLAEQVGAETGDIVDRAGRRRRLARGRARFTVGQRRGLALGVPAPDGKPRFVLEVRPVSNTVVVGPKEALATAEIAGERFTWAGLRRADGESSRATCRSARTPTRCRARGASSPTASSSSPRSSRSTGSRPARRRCSTTARACSASSRSTARCPRCPLGLSGDGSTRVHSAGVRARMAAPRARVKASSASRRRSRRFSARATTPGATRTTRRYHP